MTNHKIIYTSVVAVFVLFLSFSIYSANGQTAILAIEPTKASPGETVRIYGSDLSTEIELRASSEEIFPVTGNINSTLTEVRFEVPSNIPPGSYTIVVLLPSGAYFSSTDLNVVSGGESFKPTVNPNIPTEGLPSFGQLIALIFTWSLNILGIVVFVMIFSAGFKWFTAAGNTAKVGEARGQITNAITGAIILLAAWIILYTINPDLVGEGKNVVLPGIGGTQDIGNNQA